MSGLYTIVHGDALEMLRLMPSESVHCCITSPPYWGLRDYGTARWEGGDPACRHLNHHGEQGQSGCRADRAFTGLQNFYRDRCPQCGAVRIDQQMGLERTPAEYLCRMVEVFREVRRVLRGDGTLWLNIGDCYATGAGRVGKHAGGGVRGSQWAGRHPGRLKHGGLDTSFGAAIGPMTQPNRLPLPGLKPKDLVGIPWRLAFALQDDGWWLRADIIWAKKNPMPESVRDRPTKAHEYIFLLAKSKHYYYDANAIKEPASADTHARYARGRSDSHKNADGGPGNQTIAKAFEHMRPCAGWHQGTRSRGSAPRDRRTPGVNPKCVAPGLGIKANSSFSGAVKDVVGMRNRRSVWPMSTQPTPEAHFATFPLAIPETCLLAGCPEGGWVLDPFAGAGTTALAALKHGRSFIGIELNADYIAIANRRIAKMLPPSFGAEAKTA